MDIERIEVEEAHCWLCCTLKRKSQLKMFKGYLLCKECYQEIASSIKKRELRI